MGVLVLVAMPLVFARDKMDVIKIDKGDLFESRGDPVPTVSLSKEHAAKGCMFSNKVEVLAPAEGNKEGGSLKYKLTARKDWSEYDVLKFSIFNPSDKPITCSFMIGDKEAVDNWKYGNYYEKAWTIQPGMMEYEIDIVGLSARHGRAMNTKDIAIVIMYNLQPAPCEFYISSVHLAKEGDDSTDKKETKKEDKKEEPKKKDKK